MDTPSTGEQSSPVTALSVQTIGPGGAPEPPQPDRSLLFPLMALLVLMAFGAGYLLARSPQRSVLPEITEETTLPTTSMVRSSTSVVPTDEPISLEGEPSAWFTLPPPVLADGVTLVTREQGRWVNDVAVDAEGHVWTLGSGGAVRWDPADGTYVTFGEDVFGYAVPDQVAAGPDGAVWIAVGSQVFRFDGTWARFRSPDPNEYPVELGVTADGALVVVVVGEDEGHVRLYRTGPDGDLATVEAFDIPIFDVADTAVGPGGEVWLAGSDEGGWWVFKLEEDRLTRVPRMGYEDRPIVQIAATDSVWLTDTDEWSIWGLEAGEWVDAELPETGRGPWGGRYPWTIGAGGGAVWAAATTPDGSGLQLVRVDEPGFFVTYPPFDRAAGYVSTIEVSPDGLVWVGTEAGLRSFDPTTGSWRLWARPPAEGSVPASIDSVAVGPDGTLRAVVYSDPPRIGSFDGSDWEFDDGLVPAGCTEDDDCEVWMVGSRYGVVWIRVSTADQVTLWHNVTGHTWSPVTLPDVVSPWQIQNAAFGAGPGGTLWLREAPLTALFDGTGWTVWNEPGPDGWELLVGADGTPWMLGGGGWLPDELWFFSEGTWSPAEPPLPHVVWQVAADLKGAIWVAGDGRVWSFDGTTWTLQFEADAGVSALAPAAGGGMWMAADDLWLIGHGVPRLVVPGLRAEQLTPAPDGSVWALAEGGLYRVEYPG